MTKKSSKTKKVTKREDYISWDQYFMGIALLSSQRSKDPSTQVGACLVNPENKIVGIGYNGFPKGCSDDQFPWEREGEYSKTKYAYMCHAELNAILNSPSMELKGCVAYVSLFPCNECAKAIVQSGVTEVIYLSDKYAKDEIFIASRRILTAAGVKLRHYLPKIKNIKLNFIVEQ
ncbi:MAG: dCMP deaminase family protein [Candidatus Pacebacteria bacterium]|nr:dCMP deaminase family protein [Candidatus Paceibacterota bacterium]